MQVGDTSDMKSACEGVLMLVEEFLYFYSIVGFAFANYTNKRNCDLSLR